MHNKLATIALASVLALGVAGCGSQPESAQSEQKVEKTSKVEESTSKTEKTESTAPQVTWTDAENADKAAEGAKLQKFGVPSDITVDDVKYENAKFAYSDGTAQATYTVDGSALVVRKANKDSKVTVTDLDTTKVEANWTKTYEDLEVTCYGPAKGAAYAIVWKDGDLQYGVSRLASGDRKLTMDGDDAAAVVKAIKEANAVEEKKEEEKTESTESQSSTSDTSSSEVATDNPDYIGETAAINIAIDQVGYVADPNETYATLNVGGDAANYTVTLDYGDGDVWIVTVDALNGDVWSAEGAGSSSEVSSEGTSDSSEYDFIDEELATSAAFNGAGVEAENVDSSTVSCTLQLGGDAPHYNVTFTTLDGETHFVEVDAYTGQVWG